MKTYPRIVADSHIPFLSERLRAHAELVMAEPDAITHKMLQNADALVTRTRTRCDEKLLDGTAVKLVVTATIGTDHIDTEWCRKAGIDVRNAAGCNAPAVAQYVCSSLLRLGAGKDRFTLGVVGYGHIGTIVTEWGRKLGWNVIVCDPPRRVAGHTDEDYESLEELLPKCNAVTFHTPITRNGAYPTFHLLNSATMELLRDDAIVVNAARGGVVDNAALLKELKTGRLHGVIDTWENEPHISEELLRLVDIGTFHIAGYSMEGKQRATRMVLEALDNRFHLGIDKSGLAPDYVAPEANEITRSIIADSYNPFVDTQLLRANVKDFEKLRSNYTLRPEPAFHKSTKE